MGIPSPWHNKKITLPSSSVASPCWSWQAPGWRYHWRLLFPQNKIADLLVVVVMIIKEFMMICLTGSPDLLCEDDNVCQDHLVASDLGKRTGCFVDGAVHCTWKKSFWGGILFQIIHVLAGRLRTVRTQLNWETDKKFQINFQTNLNNLRPSRAFVAAFTMSFLSRASTAPWVFNI